MIYKEYEFKLGRKGRHTLLLLATEEEYIYRFTYEVISDLQSGPSSDDMEAHLRQRSFKRVLRKPYKKGEDFKDVPDLNTRNYKAEGDKILNQHWNSILEGALPKMKKRKLKNLFPDTFFDK